MMTYKNKIEYRITSTFSQVFNFGTYVICLKYATTLPPVVVPLELHNRYRVFEQAVVFLGEVFRNWASLVLHFLYKADVPGDTFEV